MNNLQIRRIELWFDFAVSVVIGGVFSWLAVTLELPLFWWIAGLCFFVIVPLTAWHATRPNSVIEKEEEKFEAFMRRNPILSALFTIASIVGFLWSIGSVLIRVFASLTK